MDTILREGPLCYLMVFVAGMLVAGYTVRSRWKLPQPVLLAVAALALLAIRLGTGNGLAHDAEASLVACALMLAAAQHGTWIFRALSRPWLVFLGQFSYSIYLVHAPLLHIEWLATRSLGLSPDQEFFLLLALLPITVAACFAFYTVAERPFMHSPPPLVLARAQTAQRAANALGRISYRP